MMMKTAMQWGFILPMLVGSPQIYAQIQATFQGVQTLPTAPVIVVQSPAMLRTYPYRMQPQASISYRGSKAQIGVQFPIGHSVQYAPSYQYSPSYTVPSHYQQIEQVHLPYGGTYTKKTEIIPQTPVYIQPQAIVIQQGHYRQLVH